uniref:Uncharacterized protein n=1 Tax=Trichuris muris TaxID=70415 RepID=A0A5S6QBD0_TRIMR
MSVKQADLYEIDIIMKNLLRTSAVVEHISVRKHDLLAVNLCNEIHKGRRKVKEILFIQHNDCLNRDRGVAVGDIWSNLIRHTKCNEGQLKLTLITSGNHHFALKTKPVRFESTAANFWSTAALTEALASSGKGRNPCRRSTSALTEAMASSGQGRDLCHRSTSALTEALVSSGQGRDGSRRSTAALTDALASSGQGKDGCRRSTAALTDALASSGQLVVVGDSNTGKTSFFRSLLKMKHSNYWFLSDELPEPTLGVKVDVFRHSYKCEFSNDDVHTVEVFDIGGSSFY